MKLTAALAVLALGLGLGGYATVMNGTNVDYTSESRPEGATVKFNNGATCTTPRKLEMGRKDDLRADMTREGCKPTYILIQSKLGGSAFGSSLSGGGIGAVVDGTNGARNRLYPRPLSVRMARLGNDEVAVLLDKCREDHAGPQ